MAMAMAVISELLVAHGGPMASVGELIVANAAIIVAAARGGNHLNRVIEVCICP
jgi:hypothetical protein